MIEYFVVSFHHAAAHSDCPGRLINTNASKEFSFVMLICHKTKSILRKPGKKSKETTSCSQLKLVLA